MMLESSKLTAFCATTDATRAKAFYGDALGLELRYEDDFALSFDANGTELRVQKVPDFTPQGFTVLGWQVSDVDAVVDMLATRGVTPENFEGLAQDERGVWDAPGGARIAWFRDPDGNLLSVAEYRGG